MDELSRFDVCWNEENDDEILACSIIIVVVLVDCWLLLI